MNYQLPVKPKKRLGQHFLVDKEILATIVGVAELVPGMKVLEIGPGLGVLTSVLSKAVGKEGLVLAVEADRDLVDKLRERFHSKPQVKIVAGDILATPLSTLLQAPYKIVANIPYSITSPVVTKFLLGDYRGRAGDESPRPESITLLVQQEVAERLTAKPGTRARGMLTVLIELFGTAQLVVNVPPTAFEPPPQVNSAVIHLTLSEPKVNPRAFHTLLKAGFANKRRQFHNSLAGSLHLGINEAKAIIEQAGIPVGSRAEELTLDQWLALFAVIRPEPEGER
jgi:16S rRNA (adenine1518-N6/adenine1519-N6)-dimethyltransferase